MDNIMANFKGECHDYEMRNSVAMGNIMATDVHVIAMWKYGYVENIPWLCEM